MNNDKILRNKNTFKIKKKLSAIGYVLCTFRAFTSHFIHGIEEKKKKSNISFIKMKTNPN